MYRKILVGYDCRSGGRDALALGKTLTAAAGGELLVVRIVPVGDLPWARDPHSSAGDKELANELKRVADLAGGRAEVFASSSPGRGLHDLAQEVGADLVVVGSSRRGKAKQLLAGSVGLGLLQGAACAVAVAPRGYVERTVEPLSRLVVGFDGSEEAQLALRDAVELAVEAGVLLRLVAVAPPPSISHFAPEGYEAHKDAIEEHMREQLAAAQLSIPKGVRSEATLISGDPAQKLAEAGTGGSLLMLGSRAYGPVRRVLLGSVSAALARSAPCALLVNPRGAASESEAPRLRVAG
jgi:nucleotide-binding universal stress UspA family protein